MNNIKFIFRLNIYENVLLVIICKITKNPKKTQQTNRKNKPKNKKG